jgi:hypothetical protein
VRIHQEDEKGVELTYAYSLLIPSFTVLHIKFVFSAFVEAVVVFALSFSLARVAVGLRTKDSNHQQSRRTTLACHHYSL